jgi:hypothetical protein
MRPVHYPPSRLWLLSLLVLILATFVPRAQAQQDCAGFVIPPSLPLTSFDGTYRADAYGFMTGGVTEAGCVVIDSYATMAYPLKAGITGIYTVGSAIVGVEWLVYDNGGLLPFLPFFSAGEVVWFTLRVSDGHVGGIIGLVSLAVLPT